MSSRTKPAKPLDRLAEITSKIKTLQAEKRAAKSEEMKAKRQADTRRHILDGIVVETMAARDPRLAEHLSTWRDAVLTRDHDRALFGLAPRTPPPAPPDEN